jgi:hypothetical protein
MSTPIMIEVGQGETIAVQARAQVVDPAVPRAGQGRAVRIGIGETSVPIETSAAMARAIAVSEPIDDPAVHGAAIGLIACRRAAPAGDRKAQTLRMVVQECLVPAWAGQAQAGSRSAAVVASAGRDSVAEASAVASLDRLDAALMAAVRRIVVQTDQVRDSAVRWDKALKRDSQASAAARNGLSTSCRNCTASSMKSQDSSTSSPKGCIELRIGAAVRRAIDGQPLFLFRSETKTFCPLL